MTPTGPFSRVNITRLKWPDNAKIHATLMFSDLRCLGREWTNRSSGMLSRPGPKWKWCDVEADSTPMLCVTDRACIENRDHSMWRDNKLDLLLSSARVLPIPGPLPNENDTPLSRYSNKHWSREELKNCLPHCPPPLPFTFTFMYRDHASI